jgi:mycothiol synthase
MPAESILVRNYTRHDLEAYCHLQKLARKESGEVIREEPHYTKSILTRPNYSPYQDLFVLEKENQGLIGFADIFSELAINRVIFEGFIHPDSRRTGLAARLLVRALTRSHEIGADLIHVCVNEDNHPAHQFLSAAGFSPDRCYLELEKRLDRIDGSFPVLGSGYFSEFQEGQAAMLAQVQNEVFAGSWGFCPNTTEDIRYYLKLTKTRLRDVIAVKDGKEILGYLWPLISGSSRVRKGRIHMFGVISRFRGRGLGKQLMLYALARFQQKGLETMGLTVDELNRPAVALYESLDFRVKARNIWHEKRLS